jgi:hypothetical protein
LYLIFNLSSLVSFYKDDSGQFDENEFLNTLGLNAASFEQLKKEYNDLLMENAHQSEMNSMPKKNGMESRNKAESFIQEEPSMAMKSSNNIYDTTLHHKIDSIRKQNDYLIICKLIYDSGFTHHLFFKTSF